MAVFAVAATVLLFLGAGASALRQVLLANFCGSWPQYR